jgi:hypothetical protein
MENGTDNTRFEVATNHQEIMRCDWLPISTGFIILIKTCIKTGSGTRDGFGDLVMRGKGVRHPTTFVRRRLPPSMCLCVFDQSSKNVGLLLSINISTLSGIHQLVMYALFFVPLLNISFLLGFLVKQWYGTLETLTLFTRTKLN